MNYDLLFESWLSVRASASRDPLTPHAAKPYRYIWHSWCRWLTSAPGNSDAPAFNALYLKATPQDVHQFLQQGPSPSSNRVSKTSPISEVTRRRYWRVLEAVYKHANHLGLMDANPADGLSEQDKPPTERSEGLVLSRRHFEALYQVLPAGNSLWEIRDRAMLLLLLEAALTPGEVCGLLLSQVNRDTQGPEHLSLSVTGLRRWQSREMVLTGVASSALLAWLKVRNAVDFNHDTLFVTQQQEVMTGRPLFHLVAKTVTAAAKLSMMPVPAHVGPQVLRNTRIVLWLNEGKDPFEVVKLAGYKDAKSFRGLLRHIQVRVTVPRSGFSVGS